MFYTVLWLVERSFGEVTATCCSLVLLSIAAGRALRLLWLLTLLLDLTRWDVVAINVVVGFNALRLLWLLMLLLDSTRCDCYGY